MTSRSTYAGTSISAYSGKAVLALLRLGDKNMLSLLAAIALVTAGVGVGHGQTLLGIGLALGFLSPALLSFLLVQDSRLLTRIVIVFSGVGLVCSQLQLAQGSPAVQYGPFVFLALIMLFRDARLVGLSAALFVVHHLLFDRLQAGGAAVYVLQQPDLGTVGVKLLFLVAQAAYQMRLSRQSLEQLSAALEIRLLVSSLGTEDNIQLNVSNLSLSTPAALLLQRTLVRAHEGLQQTHDAVSGIKLASQEIANGNLDLSARTERTAANLQQTAGLMNDLSQSVKSTADSAKQAAQLATTAAESALVGGEVVGQVVSTMEAISSSSKKVVDIIGVIDGIAFQTNILALNAAVESARAGEQGRGFAVVAGEVRTLAQRCAEAAKEIKRLIGASDSNVQTGAALVAQAGEKMELIVTSNQRVAATIGEISLAASTQTESLAQISSSVAELDEATQQNAALVEQAAAASKLMNEQAGHLARVVSVFKLESGANALEDGAQAVGFFENISSR